MRARSITTALSGAAVFGATLIAGAPSAHATLTAQEKVRAALLQRTDLPQVWKRSGAPTIVVGEEPAAPLPCPTALVSAEPKTSQWGQSTWSAVDVGGKRFSLQGSAWRMSQAWDSRPADSAMLIKRARDCADRSGVLNGVRTSADVRSVDSSTERTTQIMKVTRSAAPQHQVVVTTWQVVRRMVIASEVTVDGSATAAPPARQVNAAVDLSQELADRAANRVTTQSEAPDPGEVARPLGPAPGLGLPSRRELGEQAGKPWVVSLGDSYISGEAGAWDGNVENSLNDKLVYRGRSTYFDSPDMMPGGTAETRRLCHRSDSAAIHIGIVNSKNFACSGALATSGYIDDGEWKPGIDFGTEPGGKGVGQAQMLQDFAKDHDVKMVALSIGGNDAKFGLIVGTCVKNFLTSSVVWPSLCSKDPQVLKHASAESADAVAKRVGKAIANIRTAMTAAGYTEDEWVLSVQNYPGVIPPSKDFRYWQTIFRQSDGGCGFWNADADWAATKWLPTVNGAVAKAVRDTKASNVHLLDLSQAFRGHELCQKAVTTADKLTRPSRQTRFDRLEWVMQIRAISANYSEADQQESIHPNYMGQMAERNCLRRMYLNPKSARCLQDGTTITADGEPPMKLVAP